MTPEEIQRTMDFILRSQADSVIRTDRAEKRMELADKRMDRFDRNHERLQEQIDILRSAASDLLKVCRQLAKTSTEHSRRIERLEHK